MGLLVFIYAGKPDDLLTARVRITSQTD